MPKQKTLKLKTITYSRLKNLGDYENERVEIQVQVDPKSDGHEELLRAKQWVSIRLGIEVDRSSKKYRRVNGHGPVCVCDECM